MRAYNIELDERQELGLKQVAKRLALDLPLVEEVTHGDDGTEQVTLRPAAITNDEALRTFLANQLRAYAEEYDQEQAAQVARAVAADPKLLERKEAFERLSPERQAEIDRLLGLEPTESAESTGEREI